MDYTITELTDGNAVVTFADDSWANVPVLTTDTKATFEERVQGYAPKAAGSNPAWIAVNQTGSVAQLALADCTQKSSDEPSLAESKSSRIWNMGKST